MGRAAYITDPVEARDKEIAMLTDISECIGCKACEIACKQWNQNPAESTTFLGSYQSHAGVTHDTWTVIEFVEDIPEDRSDMSWMFTKMNCMHCTDAGCVAACPVDALKNTDRGYVHLDLDACIGCGYCEQACPFDMVHVTKQVFDTNKKAGKCTLCFDRIDNGLAPACVQACPTDCIKYGTREELIAWGKERVAKLKARGFENATLYGEHEAGGLHQLFVLLDGPEKYGLPVNPQVPSSVRFIKNVVHPIGKALLGATLFGLVVNFLASRRLQGPDSAETADVH